MNLRPSIAVTAMLAAHPTTAQDHRFETDPVVTVRENFVACCMSSEHFGQFAWQFKRMSGSSGLKVQAAIAC